MNVQPICATHITHCVYSPVITRLYNLRLTLEICAPLHYHKLNVGCYRHEVVCVHRFWRARIEFANTTLWISVPVKNCQLLIMIMMIVTIL
jgi:hypothetical protein